MFLRKVKEQTKKSFLTIMMFVFFATFAGAQRMTPNYDRLIKAIAHVESKGNPKAFNKNGNCAGLLQIRPILVQECNNIMKQRKSSVRYTLNDRYDPKKSIEMFYLIQEKYNSDTSVSESVRIERAIRLWNGGPGWKKNPRKTDAYLKKVLDAMK